MKQLIAKPHTMNSSIYVSSEKIEVIGYSGKSRSLSIKSYLTCDLPEGTMINGKIIDHAPLVECLIGLRDKEPELFANSTLTVDGSSILSKRIIVPKLKKMQYNQLIRDEFADTAESFGEMVCDYHISDSDGATSAILACATSGAQVESYISTFKEAGIKLKSIRVGVQSVLSYVNSRADLKKATFVLNIIDGVTMLSMIFENGVNVFMSRSRLYGEGYEQSIQNVLDNLSGLIQFNRSQNFGDITHSYYLGMSEEDMRFMDELSPYPDIALDTLDIFGGADGIEYLPAEAHFAYLSLLLGHTDIDLIRSYKLLNKLKQRQKPKKPWIPIAAAIILTFAIPFAYMSAQTAIINDDITALRGYIMSDVVAARSERLNSMIQQTTRYDTIMEFLDNELESKKITAIISSDNLDLITKTYADKVTVGQFEFDEGTKIISLSGKSATEVDSAIYVDTLRKNDKIKSIRYTGYSYDANGAYNFSIAIELNFEEAEQ